VLRELPVVVIGASTGAFGAVWSQAELRKVLAATGARVIDSELAIGHAQERFDEHGRLADTDLRARLRRVFDDLLSEARPGPVVLAA
jgi:chromate reductase, NAD(P)H dehydrogenase (quinone)